jgi:hypothetical protein
MSKKVMTNFGQVFTFSGDKVYQGYTESQIRSMSREELSSLMLAVSNNEIYRVSEERMHIKFLFLRVRKKHYIA